MFFPFMVDLSQKKIVVVGGGDVAARKCSLFLDFDANIMAVAPHFCSSFPEHSNLQRITDVFRSEYLDDAFAVVVATDDSQLNSSISLLCQERRIPANVVDCPQICSFIVPATVRQGDLTIAVSTGGKSPALAAKIKRKLAKEYNEEYKSRLELLGEIRRLALDSDMDDSKRRSFLIDCADKDIKDLLIIHTEMK